MKLEEPEGQVLTCPVGDFLSWVKIWVNIEQFYLYAQYPSSVSSKEIYKQNEGNKSRTERLM